MRQLDRLGVDICVKDRSVLYEQEALPLVIAPNL